jgi:hypothetical protein
MALPTATVTPPTAPSMSSPAMIPPPDELFAALLLESANGFAVLDASGRYVYVSTSMTKLLGLEKEAFLGCDAAAMQPAMCVQPRV